jgi:hypothetical protein
MMTSCIVVFIETINVYYYDLNSGDHFTQVKILLKHIIILMYPFYSAMESETFFITANREDSIGEFIILFFKCVSKLSETIRNS